MIRADPGGHHDYFVVLVDADSDELVRLPGPPFDHWELMGLSSDGSQLLLREHSGSLCVCDLGTGRLRWFRPTHPGGDMVAALSPDGQTIASLSVPDDPDSPVRDASLSAVDLIDIPTGQRQRLWARPGSWSAESAVAWSPDGQLIAVTHYIWLDDPGDWFWNTTVLDQAGQVVWQCVHAVIPPATNGAWVGTRQLAVSIDEDDRPLLTVDVEDGTRRAVGPGLPIPHAVTGNRKITSARYDHGHPHHWVLITTTLDGNDPQPLITTTPGPTAAGIIECDLAR